MLRAVANWRHLDEYANLGESRSAVDNYKYSDTTIMPDRLLSETRAFFETMRHDPSGVGVVFGADAVVQSEVIQDFVAHCPNAGMVALVDASGLKPAEFLFNILAQYGYAIESSSERDLHNMLRVVLMQFAGAGGKPLLIVSNLNRTNPHTLGALCRLAALRSADDHALNMVLVGERYYRRILEAPNMTAITERLAGSFELTEAAADPVVYVSLDGLLLDKIELTDTRTLIGRSEFCDIRLDSDGVSRQHAILLIQDDVVVLMDLRSKNGVWLNSQKVASAVLRDSDILEIGEHRLKIRIPVDYRSGRLAAVDISDTSKMQTLADARQKRQRERQRLPAAGSESG